MRAVGQIRTAAERVSDFRRLGNVAAGLVGTQVATALLGFVYWTLAARLFLVGAIGLANAAISAMQLLGTVGMLGLGTLLIAKMTKVAQGRRRLLVRTALAASAAASLVLGLLFAVVAHLAEPQGLGGISSTPLIAALFAAGVMAAGSTMVLDQAVLGLGSGALQLERNVVASVTKIIFLLALSLISHTSGMTIYLSWFLGTCASLPLVAYRTRGGLSHQVSKRLFDVTSLKGLGRAAAGHHMMNLTLQAPLMLLPVIVAATLSTHAAGYFATALLVSGFVFMLPYAVSLGLFASADGDAASVGRRAKITVPFGLIASVAADIVLFFAGPYILAAFGHQYAEHSLTPLRLLTLAGLPLVIKDHFVALRRVEDRTIGAAGGLFIAGIVEVVAATLGAVAFGVNGLCVAWVSMLVVEAVVLGGWLRRDITRLTGDAPRAESPSATPSDSTLSPADGVPAVVS